MPNPAMVKNHLKLILVSCLQMFPWFLCCPYKFTLEQISYSIDLILCYIKSKVIYFTLIHLVIIQLCIRRHEIFFLSGPSPECGSNVLRVLGFVFFFFFVMCTSFGTRRDNSFISPFGDFKNQDYALSPCSIVSWNA